MYCVIGGRKYEASNCVKVDINPIILNISIDLIEEHGDYDYIMNLDKNHAHHIIIGGKDEFPLYQLMFFITEINARHDGTGFNTDITLLEEVELVFPSPKVTVYVCEEEINNTDFRNLKECIKLLKLALGKIPEEFRDKAEIDIGEYGYGSNIYYERPETEEDRKIKIEKEEIRQREEKQKELEQLKILKAKYEV